MHLQILLNSYQFPSEPFSNCIRPIFNHFKAHNFPRFFNRSNRSNFCQIGNQSSLDGVRKRIIKKKEYFEMVTRLQFFFQPTDSKRHKLFLEYFCAMHICAKLHILVFSLTLLFLSMFVYQCVGLGVQFKHYFTSFILVTPWCALSAAKFYF